MEELLEWLEYIEEVIDSRQQSKVRYRLKDIVIIVLFATLANADDWVEIGIFAAYHEEYLRKYTKLDNGVPSHDTIQRVMALVSPEIMQQISAKWQEVLNSNEGEKLRKIISMDGKTMRGNTRNGSKPSHVVSAWCDEDGFCLGQVAVEEKSNEITAIPELLDKINVKGQIITIDAMGTQTEIAAKIRQKRADYVLALKGNQSNLHDDVKEYFQDKDFCEQIKKNGQYRRTVEKAHSQKEVREYFQTEDIKWLPQRSRWKGLKSVGMERKTITRKDGSINTENRYFISSLGNDIDLFSRAIRKHWSVEVMHWHLDVTFREDANQTIDKNAAQNLNILRKFCLSILKTVEIFKPKLSMKKKRFVIAQDVEKFLDIVMCA
ncbi:MAG: ISAs1 family transposase [Prevotella sp.]|nr:ISAs1 family transposase [Prevotella sp.]